MKILVTGFGLWGDATTNPSWEMIKDLPKTVGQHEIVLGKVSVVYNKIENEIKNLIDTNKPDMIISFGLSGSLFKPRVETYGWNLAGSGADADGNNYNGRLNTSLNARVGYKTTYNGQTVMDWVKGTNQTIETSNDPGKFLCNALIYYTVQYLSSRGLNTPYMFTHVPKETTYGAEKLKDLAKILIKKAVELNDQPLDWSLASGTAENSTPIVEEPIKPTPQPTNDNRITDGDSWIEYEKLYNQSVINIKGKIINDSLFKIPLAPTDEYYKFISYGKSMKNIEVEVLDIQNKEKMFKPTIEVIDYYAVKDSSNIFLKFRNGRTLLNDIELKVAIDPEILAEEKAKLAEEKAKLAEEKRRAEAQITENLLTGVSPSDYTPSSIQTRYSLKRQLNVGQLHKFVGQIENLNTTNTTIKLSIGDDNPSNEKISVELKPGMNDVMTFHTPEKTGFNKFYILKDFNDKITIKSSTIKLGEISNQ